MAVAFSQEVDTASVSASSVSIGPITPSGDDRLMVAVVCPADAGGANNITLDEVAHDTKDVTNDGAAIYDSGAFGTYYRVHKQYILQPNAVSANVVFTLSEAPDHGGLGAAFYTGVHQTTPVGTPASKQANDDNPTVTLTDGATGDLVTDVIGGNGFTLSVAGGGTLIFKHEDISGYVGIGMAWEAGAASVERSWTWTDAHYAIAATTLFAAPTIVREQEGYRWRDDDGSESAATWLQNQEVNITRAKATNTRLRVLANYTDEPPSEQTKLQYRKVGDPDSEWRDV